MTLRLFTYPMCQRSIRQKVFTRVWVWTLQICRKQHTRPFVPPIDMTPSQFQSRNDGSDLTATVRLVVNRCPFLPFGVTGSGSSSTHSNKQEGFLPGSGIRVRRKEGEIKYFTTTYRQEDDCRTHDPGKGK